MLGNGTIQAALASVIALVMGAVIMFLGLHRPEMATELRNSTVPSISV